MSEQTPALSLPLLMPSQAQKHVTHNEALMLLDMVVQLTVEGHQESDPPSEPSLGARYILGAAPTGDWAGHAGEIALWDGYLWRFLLPRPGWRADITATGQSLRYSGSAWEAVLPELQNLPHLGIATAADNTNRLAVSARATLLTHAGAGHQLKLNKSAPGDTASLLFQTGWEGRAEMGTGGSDDFSIKVSADGSSWQEALHIDRSTGQVSLPQGSPNLRERLNAPRSYYVRSDGSDSNSGQSDSAAGAFLTLQHAVDLALTLDNGPHEVRIEVGPGSYGEDLQIAGGLPGSGALRITGDVANPAMVSLSRISCSAGARVALAGLELSGADALLAESGAWVALADLRFTGSGAGITATSAELACAGADLYLGSGLSALAQLRGHARLLAAGGTFTLGTGITWGGAQAGGLDLSGFCHADLTGVSFAGDTAGCTGPRYALAQNAILDSGGAGASFVPGSQNGITSSGGQFL
ncbi:ribonuclease III [Roseobacter sp. SK209-2-6]|uniref:DUF2793 domain-containing protein n=1 Tax=Roseobacter sp. SK209-2-6 TaxID=388739 RepID=UPI0000F3EB95|nr:DUF2793 domain-containing protein [Roseobacter sp. SK209-2-6]EBA14280.1 ribonuclease III [Roseobacter sp. SK209-2-6]